MGHHEVNGRDENDNATQYGAVSQVGGSESEFDAEIGLQLQATPMLVEWEGVLGTTDVVGRLEENVATEEVGYNCGYIVAIAAAAAARVR